MGNTLFLLLLTMLTTLSSCQQTTYDEARFNMVVEKIESDVKALRDEAERLYSLRCNEETIASCEAATYGSCVSQFPNPECRSGPNFELPNCGNESCASQWDFTISSTSIPAYLANGQDGNPTDPSVIEALCFTRGLDEWLIQKRNEDLTFWQNLGIDTPSMYFGSNTGAFRIFPARHTANCGEFDPRTRVWFVGGGSGPKNLIMILDISGSIDELRLSFLKQAAVRVLTTLTVHDRVTIIPFATNATKIADPAGRMFQATAENIDFLSKEIDELVAGGRTNFYGAFEAAFEVFEDTVDAELHVGCNSAILFFTDGERTDGPENEEVTTFVQERMASIQARINRPMLLMTYSISQDEKVHEYPAQLACAVDQGLWSKISSDDDIIESLSTYYRLFAAGLGSATNKDFVAWVEPYYYFTGHQGVTASTGVYDRSKSPPLLVGVVGVDIPMLAFDGATGVNDAASAKVRAESIRRIVLSSRVTCPNLNLTRCELAAWRNFSMPDGSGSCSADVCTAEQVVVVEEEACPGRADYPTQFLANTDAAGSNYSTLSCCRLNQTTEADMCPGPFLYANTPTAAPSTRVSPTPTTEPTLVSPSNPPTNESTVPPPTYEPTVTPPFEDTPNDAPISGGAIAGIVVGAILGIVLGGALIAWTFNIEINFYCFNTVGGGGGAGGPAGAGKNVNVQGGPLQAMLPP